MWGLKGADRLFGRNGSDCLYSEDGVEGNDSNIGGPGYDY
ncbi:MAG: hypothetical protein ACRDHV_07800 [Actinomycetota bacterium]